MLPWSVLLFLSTSPSLSPSPLSLPLSLKPGRSIDCEELIQMVEEGAQFLLIDVRDKKEIEIAGSIQGAKSIPLPELKTALLLDDGKLNFLPVD